jgi:hypothetical protein
MIKSKKVKYDFIEMMSCPGGCVNGAAQIRVDKTRDDIFNDIKKGFNDLTFENDAINKSINDINKLVEELKITTKQSVKLQYKKDDLQEDCLFYEKQIEDMKDMNIYLKYKLKLFFGDIPEEDRNQIQAQEIDKEINEENTFKNKKINSAYNEKNNIEKIKEIIPQMKLMKKIKKIQKMKKMRKINYILQLQGIYIILTKRRKREIMRNLMRRNI